MGKRDVVVVDDDEDNLSIMEAAIASFGFAVRSAGSLAAAKALLEERPADALVSDFSLGDGTALELMETLGDRKPELAVLVTGFGGHEDREAAKQAGFHVHLLKPISFQDLRKVLGSATTSSSAPPAK